MEDQAVGGIFAGTSDSDLLDYHEGISSNENGVQEIQQSMKILINVDLDLACSSEKLVNLHILLMYLLAQENDVQAMALENSYISTDSMEKVMVFDLLSGVLDDEVREMGSFLDTPQAEILDVRHRMSSWGHQKELLNKVEEKLHDTEQSLKQSRMQILGVEMQLAKFQRSILASISESGKLDKAMEFSENRQVSNINPKSNLQMAKQQRHLLRMLEKSLARELDLEKKLEESRQNEDGLKIKLHYTEQVSLRMEEAAEFVWGRFFEAENASEVLMNMSREFACMLQLVGFRLNSSIQRESEMETKLQDCIKELKNKDIALEKLESRNAELTAQSSEVHTLREKVNLLEEILSESQFQLNDANASKEASQEQLSEMENVIESLKESIHIAESRAETAEAKSTQLTETNLELTEELNFHKESASNSEKKVGALEKQVRELEIQLQNARASSEANQEQQNMLYSAIWDMETLIEDLKSKVSKAESKLDTAEEQHVLLSETNSELNNELSFLKSRMEFLETSLDQAKNAKLESAKEINVKTKFILDKAMQLAIERERIQNQDTKLDLADGASQQSGESVKDDAEIRGKGDHNPTPTTSKNFGKHGKQGSQASDQAKEEYIHVRARRGPATDSHSLAERVRREKISERMKFLQDLVPGCSKVTGKAVMLDEIINYVQSLQRQVEFLSMKVAAVNPRLDLNIEGLLAKNIFQTRAGSSSALGFSPDMSAACPLLLPSHERLIEAGLPGMGNSSDLLRRGNDTQLTPMSGGFKEPAQLANVWEDELHNAVRLRYGSSAALHSEGAQGSLATGHLKSEP